MPGALLTGPDLPKGADGHVPSCSRRPQATSTRLLEYKVGRVEGQKGAAVPLMDWVVGGKGILEGPVACLGQVEDAKPQNPQ